MRCALRHLFQALCAVLLVMGGVAGFGVDALDVPTLGIELADGGRLGVSVMPGASGVSAMPRASELTTAEAVATEARFDESCDDEASSMQEFVVCGSGVAGVWISGDAGVLRMSRKTCSVLLDQLFDTMVCDPSQEDCSWALPGGAAPMGVQLASGAPAGASLLATDGLSNAPRGGSVALQSGFWSPTLLEISPPVRPPRSLHA